MLWTHPCLPLGISAAASGMLPAYYLFAYLFHMADFNFGLYLPTFRKYSIQVDYIIKKYKNQQKDNSNAKRNIDKT